MEQVLSLSRKVNGPEHPDTLSAMQAVAFTAPATEALKAREELLALRRMPTTTFAVLMSLGPAVAAIAGYLVLDQRLSPVEGLAIALVVAANIGAVRTSSRRRLASVVRGT